MKKILIKLTACLVLFLAGIIFKTTFLDITMSLDKIVIVGGIMSLGIFSSVMLILDYEE